MQSYWNEFKENSERILLLQGPIGPFFWHLKELLVEEYGKQLFKINFNGGDAYYFPQESREGQEAYVTQYQGDPTQFSHYLTQFILRHKIDTVLTFGDERLYHKIAHDCCKAMGNVTFWAFEEGYLRPHYITLEKWGVNYNSVLTFTPDEQKISQITKSLQALKQARKADDSAEKKAGKGEQNPAPVAAGFWRRATLAMRYYFEMHRQRRLFPHYQHHRETRLPIYAGAWAKAVALQLFHLLRDYPISHKIRQKNFGKFYIFPLQVHDDSQILRHGRGNSIPGYIRLVINSFAKHAPKESRLVIKHHPMDRGFNNYRKLITRLAKRHQIAHRVIYLHEIPMPDLLRAAAGMVVINSTSGISALIHRLPVKVIGDAHYNIPTITAQCSLAEFWQELPQPNIELTDLYLDYLLEKTQINGSFYYRSLLCIPKEQRRKRREKKGEKKMREEKREEEAYLPQEE